MLIQEFKDFVDRQRWTNAKTYEDFAPHEYINKYDLSYKEMNIFDRLVLYIRNEGYPKRFGKRTFIYLDIGKYCYWTMGDAPEKTFIMNRAIRKENKGLSCFRQIRF